MLITLEGVDGVGKDYVAEHLQTRLRYVLKDKVRGVVILNEPSRDPNSIGGYIRKNLVEGFVEFNATSQLMLQVAARVENLQKHILPLLEKGYVVICTRNGLSSLVYQLPDIPPELETLSRGAVQIGDLVATSGGGSTVPHVNVLLTTTDAVLYRRLGNRVALDRLENVDPSVIVERQERYQKEADALGFITVDNSEAIDTTIDTIMENLKDVY